MSDRAHVMDLIVQTYVACARVPSGSDDDEKVISLLKDIRHHCRSKGLHFYDLMLEACARFAKETDAGDHTDDPANTGCDRPSGQEAGGQDRSGGHILQAPEATMVECLAVPLDRCLQDGCDAACRGKAQGQARGSSGEETAEVRPHVRPISGSDEAQGDS